MKLFTKSEDGFTLLGVLMVLAIFSILGFSILAVTANSVKLSDSERDDQSVFYIAEAGLVEKVAEIEGTVGSAFEKVNDRYNRLTSKEQANFDFEGEFYKEVIKSIELKTTKSNKFEASFGKQPAASVTVTRKKVENPLTYMVTSIGTIGNRSRTVTQELKVSLDYTEDEGTGSVANTAVYVNKKLTLSGGVAIYGDAAIKSENPHNIIFSGAGRVEGEIYQGVNHSVELPTFPGIPKYTIPADKKISNKNGNTTDLVKDGDLLIGNYITDGYILNMNENLEYKEILLNENNSLTINVGNTDKEIVVEHLNLTNGHIDIIGNGKLTIFVKEKITMGSGSTINSNTKDVRKLQIYQKGSQAINLAGSQKVYGSLYAEKSNISIGAGGGFQGNIFSGGEKVTVDGGASISSQLFLVPNAKFTLEGGGTIRGAIVADVFEGSGGGFVRYEEFDSEVIPGGGTIDYGDGSDLIEREPIIEK